MQHTPPSIFDHAARSKHLARWQHHFSAHDFLWREAADMLAESLASITYPFATVVDLMPRSAHLRDHVCARAGTQEVTQASLANEMLGLAENSVDAIFSNLSLHTINDLPGVLIQIRRALKADGLFMATLPGAESLRELRTVLAATETALCGGITPRVVPFLDVREAGNVLQRAGFALPVVDSTLLPISYSSMAALMAELRGAGEANMLVARKKSFTARQLFVQAAQQYEAQYRDDQGRITASAEIITLTAWKPAPSQQQPAKRGSGKTSLTAIF